MRLTLTDSVRKFINTLSEADLKRVTIMEDVLESDDPELYEKFIEYKVRLAAAGYCVRVATEQFRKEHPEYFE